MTASHSCPSCKAALTDDEVLTLATDRAQTHLEGGDQFNGGEVYASCPRCGAEIVIETEGHTEYDPAAVVSQVVALR